MASEAIEDKWREIEGRVFGRCVWQHILPDRRVMLEGLLHKATGQVWIVEKGYDGPIPRSGSAKAWPELGRVAVYREVAPEVSEWKEFEKALG